ncbi:GlxA family transcriptional regulator [Kribbella shirazensis]|uniref:Transcriptional regulator GlxA family with amidase domain n=1 Tax=Kribbella shirazensis TaxID=1105143 RepID=A0A7X6A4C2_9ACTN|nr:DJ-1/PfpI family protein [Kribbella shirazensis]NIK61337.1 transcriptional regulator GlxA family with amidase domain [Kribbella shirazensis]
MSGSKIIVVAYDGVRLLDVSGPVEVFTVANEHGARYDVKLASLGGRAVRTSGGVRLMADLVLEQIDDRDTAITVIPGSPDLAAANENLLAQVRRLAATSDRVAAVCAGAFVLAEAGLLGGRRAATHWALADRLARDYPAIEVDADAIFVQDGKYLSSAGITAGIDLALAMVEADHGAAFARTVARQLVVFMQRPGGQSQFSVRVRAECERCDDLRPVLDSVVLDPAGDHRLAALAARAAVSVRQLTRMFRDEVGTTPARYVEQVRVEHAKNLLETGDQSIETIARQAGFGSPEALRRAFVRTVRITPTAYRARFRSTGAHP